MSKTNQLICSNCGHVGKIKLSIKGNLLIEIILWLFFLIPGIIYSIWRQSSYHDTCSACGSRELIPIDSPLGIKLLSDQGKKLEDFNISEKMDTGDVHSSTYISKNWYNKMSVGMKALVWIVGGTIGLGALIISLIVFASVTS